MRQKLRDASFLSRPAGGPLGPVFKVRRENDGCVVSHNTAGWGRFALPLHGAEYVMFQLSEAVAPGTLWYRVVEGPPRDTVVANLHLISPFKTSYIPPDVEVVGLDADAESADEALAKVLARDGRVVVRVGDAYLLSDASLSTLELSWDSRSPEAAATNYFPLDAVRAPAGHLARLGTGWLVPRNSGKPPAWAWRVIVAALGLEDEVRETGAALYVGDGAAVAAYASPPLVGVVASDSPEEILYSGMVPPGEVDAGVAAIYVEECESEDSTGSALVVDLERGRVLLASTHSGERTFPGVIYADSVRDVLDGPLRLVDANPRTMYVYGYIDTALVSSIPRAGRRTVRVESPGGVVVSVGEFDEYYVGVIADARSERAKVLAVRDAEELIETLVEKMTTMEVPADVARAAGGAVSVWLSS